MKNRFLIRGGLFVSLSVLLLMTSCKKDSTSNSGDQTEDEKNAPALALSDSSATANFAYTDVTNNVFYGYADNMIMPTNVHSKHAGSVGTMSTSVNGRSRLSCATATLTSTDGGYPMTLVLDYGSGCSNSVDSILRTGKITYVYARDIFWQGGSVTATFDKYTVNGYSLQGTYTLVNNSNTFPSADQSHSDSVTIFNTKIENGVFTFPDGKSYQYSDNKTYKTIAPPNSYYSFAFDSLSITGESHIIAATGDSLSTSISTPLVKRLDCRNIGFGIESFVFNGKISGTLDFGNGDCDNTATVTVGNSSKAITLH